MLLVELDEAAQAIITAGMICLSVAAGTNVILQANPTLLWALLNLLQTFYYLLLIQVDYPPNIQAFLQHFDIVKLDFIPNPIEPVLTSIYQDNSLEAPAKFEDNGIDALFLSNANTILFISSIYFCIYVLALLFRKCLPVSCKRTHKVLLNTKEWFEWSGLLGVLIGMYPEIVQAALLQTRVLTFTTSLFSASSVCGIIFTVFGAAFPVLTIIIIRKTLDDSAILSKKYRILVENCNLAKRISRYFTSISIVRMLIVNIALVFLEDYPIPQVVCLTLASFGTVFLLSYRFFTSRLENYYRIVTEVFFAIIHLIIFVFALNDHSGLFSDDTKTKIGWAMIACCSTILVIILAKTFYQQFLMFRDIYQTLKQLWNRRKPPQRMRIQLQSSTIQDRSSLEETSTPSTNILLNNVPTLPKTIGPLPYSKKGRDRRLSHQYDLNILDMSFALRDSIRERINPISGPLRSEGRDMILIRSNHDPTQNEFRRRKYKSKESHS